MYIISIIDFDFIIIIMSFTLSVTGNRSLLITNYSPTLELDGEYECALLYLSTFNSIPNVDRNNNMFYYGDNDVIEIPEGAYELQDLNDYLKGKIKDKTFNIFCNNNTLKTYLFSNETIHFEKERGLGNLLGFGNITLSANKLHESQHPVNILSTTVVRIECDIVSGSYINGTPSHIIHEFAPNVPPGYRLIEIPKNIIYFPVNQNDITSINIRILDVHNNLINLRGEEVQLYLHLRKK